jgi:uncharacterized protein (TIGR02996 family)
MTTTDELALLRTICEQPDCDVPRLVYADWSEEHGQPERAEFIRLQIEIQKDPHCEAVRNDRWNWETHLPIAWKNAILLHKREMKLLWKMFDENSHNWERWCWSEHISEDGTPCPKNDRSYSVVCPSGSPGLGHGSCGCTVDFGGGRVQQLFRRGFVAEILCTLAEFIGEQCYQCGGCGLATLDHSDDGFHCSVCNGTGTFPGLARTLFGTHPITQVVLTDREPLEFEGRWLWHNADHRLTSSEYDGDTRPAVIFADHLPAVIFDRLTGFAKRNGKVTEMVKNYPTRESTMQALSLAAVNYARSLHDLPPLEKDQAPA